MHIAIVGAGRIGGTAARSWSRAGHDVLISFSRHPDQLAARATELGDHVTAAAPAHAVAEADVVMLAVPWDAIDQALAEAGPLAGRVVIDTTNRFGAAPGPQDGQFNSARMPGASYVRAFNTLTSSFQADASRRRGDERAVLFLCGDYPAAKRTVSTLIEDAGFAAVDLGSNADAAVMEAPRRPGSVYGEEYRLPEALAVVEALGRGQAIPPTPRY